MPRSSWCCWCKHIHFAAICLQVFQYITCDNKWLYYWFVCAYLLHYTYYYFRVYSFYLLKQRSCKSIPCYATGSPSNQELHPEVTAVADLCQLGLCKHTLQWPHSGKITRQWSFYNSFPNSRTTRLYFLHLLLRVWTGLESHVVPNPMWKPAGQGWRVVCVLPPCGRK